MTARSRRQQGAFKCSPIAMPFAMADGARVYILTARPFTSHVKGTGIAGPACRRRFPLNEYLDFHESPALPCDRSRRAYYRRLCEYSSDSIRNRDTSGRRANVVLDARRMPVPAREGELRSLKPPLVSRHIRKSKGHPVCMHLIRDSSRQLYRFQQVIKHEHS